MGVGNAGRALFPLIIIVALVYLAAQTVLADKGSERIAYGDLVAKVETSPRSISSVLFVPNHHEIRVTLADGSTVKSNYPTEASQLEFQHVLQDANIPFDSRGTGGSAWWSILTYLLPFALFFAFWIFLKRQVDARRARRDEPSTREDPFEN
jgi:cell division protease FtsH